MSQTIVPSTKKLVVSGPRHTPHRNAPSDAE